MTYFHPLDPRNDAEGPDDWEPTPPMPEIAPDPVPPLYATIPGGVPNSDDGYVVAVCWYCGWPEETLLIAGRRTCDRCEVALADMGIMA